LAKWHYLCTALHIKKNIINKINYYSHEKSICDPYSAGNADFW